MKHLLLGAVVRPHDEDDGLGAMRGLWNCLCIYLPVLAAAVLIAAIWHALDGGA